MTSPLVTFDLIAARQSVRRKQGAAHIADIGKDNGEIYVKNNPGYIWVRDALSIDSTTGITTYGQAYQARSQKNHLVGYGIRVRVIYDTVDDEWEVDRTDFQTLVDQGINPAIENPSNPYNKQYDMRSLPPLLTYAVSSSGTPTTEVSVKNLIYLDYLGDVKAFQLPNGSRPDIGDNEPGTGLKRLVHLWLNHDNTVTQTVSTPISVAEEFSVGVDLAECMENPPNNLSLPIGAWKIENGQTAITPPDLKFDTRQWINAPTAPGIPNPVEKNYIIPAGQKVIVHGGLEILAGFEVLGDLLILDDTPISHPVGHMYQDDTSTVVTITDIDADVIVDDFSLKITNGMSFQSGQELVIDRAGIYDVSWQLSFTAAAANQEIEGAIGIDGVREGDTSSHRKISTGTDTGSMSGTGVLVCAIGDLVQLLVRNETSTNNVTVEHAQVKLIHINDL